MTPKELKRLSRGDLLEMLLDLSKENEQLRQENLELRKQLADRSLVMENCGSLAEAVLHLNNVFQAAQDACDQYKDNVYQRAEEYEQQVRQRCEVMISQAKAEAQELLDAARSPEGTV